MNLMNKHENSLEMSEASHHHRISTIPMAEGGGDLPQTEVMSMANYLLNIFNSTSDEVSSEDEFSSNDFSDPSSNSTVDNNCDTILAFYDDLDYALYFKIKSLSLSDISTSSMANEDSDIVSAANQLPDLVLTAIFDFLSLEDILRCAGVCRRWRSHLMASPRWRSLHLGQNYICHEDGSIDDFVYLSGIDKVKLTSSSFPVQMPAGAEVNQVHDAFPLMQIKSVLASDAQLRDLDLSGATLDWDPQKRDLFDKTIAEAGLNQLTTLTLPRGYEPTTDGLKALFRVCPELEKLKVFIPAANARYWRASVPCWLGRICQIADGSSLKHLILDMEICACHEPISRGLIPIHSTRASHPTVVSQLAHLELAVLSYLDIEHVLLNYPTLQILKIGAIYSQHSCWFGKNEVRKRNWHLVGSEITWIHFTLGSSPVIASQLNDNIFQIFFDYVIFYIGTYLCIIETYTPWFLRTSKLFLRL